MRSEDKNLEFIEISWTSGSIDDARRIARHLVRERYVASAQIIPWVESVYMLDNELDVVQESKVILKARLESFDAVKEVIEKNSKYEIPEIIWSKIDGGNKKYFEWLNESITKIFTR